MADIRIYLTGFMTSGKSTIGPILANVLGLEFVDLDTVIEAKESKTIVQIFETEGEEYFRDLETRCLQEISTREKIIVSLGGGTMTSEINLKILKDSGKIIYLKVSPDALYKRLKNKIDRPLFKDLVLNNSSEKDFVERISEMLEKREIYYNQADLVIRTDITPIGITVDKIAKKIRDILHEKY